MARQIGIVLCRVGAAVLTVQAIRTLGYSLPGLVYSDSDFASEIIGFSLLSVLPGLAAIGLWVFADRISAVVAPVDSPATPEPLTGVDLVRIGTALIGMYLAVTAVIDGINLEVANLATPELDAGQSITRGEHAARMTGLRVSVVAQLLIGVAMLIGRHRISAALAQAKIAGVSKR